MVPPALERLRRHLDAQPIGFPSAGGLGKRILERLFEPREALIALFLDWEGRSLDGILERIRARLAEGARGLDAEEAAWLATLDNAALADSLRAMAAKGAILHRADGDGWELMPWIIGMFELQLPRLDRGLYRDTVAYLKKGYGLEFVAAGAPQTRVIPIKRAVKAPGSKVLPYVELDRILEAAGQRIALVPCICRTGADLEGRPCGHTDRRELCMALRDFADAAIQQGWGRQISLEEARETAARNLADGLVIETSNEAEPQFVCACCSDCCGPLQMAKATRRAADVIASSARVRVEQGACVACGLCVPRCPMGALSLKGRGRGGALLIDYGMCLGCGVCLPACPRGALSLEARPDAQPLPPDATALKAALRAGAASPIGKLARGLKAVLGIPRSAKGEKDV